MTRAEILAMALQGAISAQRPDRLKCNNELIDMNVPMPRTCAVHGIGPCPPRVELKEGWRVPSADDTPASNEQVLVRYLDSTAEVHVMVAVARFGTDQFGQRYMKGFDPNDDAGYLQRVTHWMRIPRVPGAAP